MASRMVYVNDLVTVDLISRRRKTSVGHITSLVKGKTAKKQNFPQPIVGVVEVYGSGLMLMLGSKSKTHDSRSEKKPRG